MEMSGDIFTIETDMKPFIYLGITDTQVYFVVSASNPSGAGVAADDPDLILGIVSQVVKGASRGSLVSANCRVPIIHSTGKI